MFAVVLAATLFILTAATGSSIVDSCTASLPSVVAWGGDECSASGVGELVSEVNQNISTLLQGIVQCMLLGHSSEYPANSCAELAE